MKPVYSNITPQRGLHVAGICKLHLIPKEWLLEDAVIDFNTGTVLTNLVVEPYKNFIELDLVEDSMEYNQTPKSTGAGTYYEITATGVLNTYSDELLQVLETLRYHEHVVKLKDNRRQWRLVGNRENGMLFQYSQDESNENNGTSRVLITLKIELEQAPPFYAVDGSSIS